MTTRRLFCLCSMVFLAGGSAVWALDPNLPPGSNFDLSHWKLTLPIDSSGGNTGNPASVAAGQLVAGFVNPYFYTGLDGALVFWCPANGAHTFDESPRSELREMLDPGNDAINWTGYGTHILNAQCKVTLQPSTKKVIVGQIHGYSGNAYPLIKLQFSNGTLEALVKPSPNTADSTKYLFANVGLGNLIAYQIKLEDGLLTVTVNGLSQGTNVFLSDPDWASQTLYFKAGNFCQDKTDATNSAAEVLFYQLGVSHTNGAAPTITTHPASQTVPRGSNATFNVTASGSPSPGYCWRWNGTNLVGATDSSLTLLNVQTANAGNYSVVVSNASGAVTSVVATLTVMTNASGFPPAGNFNLSHWKLTLPIDSTGGNIGIAAEKSAAQLAAGFTNEFFYTGSNGEMVFWCPADGAKTAGTTYPRSELRELLNPPNDSVNWSGWGTHILDAQCKVTRQPSTKKVIIGQIHGYTGAARPLIKLQFNNGTVEALVKFSPNFDTETKYTFANVGLSNLIAYQIKLADGLLTVTVNGISKGTNIFLTDPDWANQTLYFKAGNYLQDNVGTSTNGAVVSFSQLSLTHTTPVNSPPRIGVIANQTVDPGTPVSLFIPAGDDDLPVQTLAFALLGPPLGASVDAAGLFTWTPSQVQGLTTNLITVRVTDNGTPPLSATQSFTIVVNAGNPCTGYKADVTGITHDTNDAVTISDWVLIGRFVSFPETFIPTNDCQFAKADCGRTVVGGTTNFCGNGVLTVQDWVQAGRFAAQLDPLVSMTDCPPPGGGGLAPASLGTPIRAAGLRSPNLIPASLTSRALIITNMAVEHGQTNCLQILLDAQGDENGFQFSLAFDTNRLAYVSASLAGAINAPFSSKNTTKLTNGWLGLIFGLNPGETLPEGLQPVWEVCFRAAAGTDVVSTSVTITNRPFGLELVDDAANVLPVTVQNGTVVLTSGMASAFEAIQMLPDGQARLRLLGAPGGIWGLEVSLDLEHWERLITLTNETGVLEYLEPAPADAKQRFYRAVLP